jgi:hypothetical protein
MVTLESNLTCFANLTAGILNGNGFCLSVLIEKEFIKDI